MPLQGKVALITGSSTGIGRETALELARRGCDLVINHFRDPGNAAEVVREIEALGRRAIAAGADVGDAAEVDGMFAAIDEAFGGLDILVNNAGTQVWAPLLELSEADWDRVIDTNLKGTFLCAQRAGRRMRDRGWGRVINIGSASNRVAFPKLVSYTASRGGIEMFTKVAAAELGQYGITVNCVAPGAIETERTKLEAPDYAGMWGKVMPMGRVGRPGDIASTIAFLVSDEAEYITGQTLFVDGGYLTRGIWPYEN